MQQVLQLDRQAFYYINSVWQNAVFDNILPLVRHPNFSFPLYVFLLLYMAMNYHKNVWIWILSVALLVTFTNYISSDIIKECWYRLRPCNDNTLLHPARLLLGYRPQSSSFISSHATNHFGMALFFYYTLKPYFGKKSLLFLLWAGTIAYAQVYVGVHFPLDVVCGAFVGSIFGYLAALIFNKYISLV